MQEQKTNLEKIINSSIDEIRQKMLTICENGYKGDLDYNSAIGFIGRIKEVISELGCQVVKGYFESRDEPVPYIGLDNKRYLNKGAKAAKKLLLLWERLVFPGAIINTAQAGTAFFRLTKN